MSDGPEEVPARPRLGGVTLDPALDDAIDHVRALEVVDARDCLGVDLRAMEEVDVAALEHARDALAGRGPRGS